MLSVAYNLFYISLAGISVTLADFSVGFCLCAASVLFGETA